MSETGALAQRIDKWLWHARIFKTRSVAARFAAAGKVRVNNARVTKASHPVSAGDVLTFALVGRVRVLKVAAFVERRGSSTIALTLYEDLSPPPPTRDDDAAGAEPGGAARRDTGLGRPTKRERRQIDAFTSSCD